MYVYNSRHFVIFARCFKASKTTLCVCYMHIGTYTYTHMYIRMYVTLICICMSELSIAIHRYGYVSSLKQNLVALDATYDGTESFDNFTVDQTMTHDAFKTAHQYIRHSHGSNRPRSFSFKGSSVQHHWPLTALVGRPRASKQEKEGTNPNKS